ncbi:L,D-transpeptidase [Methylobacterium sp. JK268]
MRIRLWLIAGAAAAVLGGSASAQEAGRYGGGFIEYLMTGRDPAVVARPYRAAPVAPDGTPIAYRRAAAVEVPAGVDAPDGVHGRTRMAALPGGLSREEVEEGSGIARVVEERYRRQVVPYAGGHRPGTVVIDTQERLLYLVQPGGQAIRYGIGVGRPGFSWAGVKTVSQKREWPDWTPPPEMIRRRPDLPRHMEGGPANPLGARALYLGSSLYRIHGTNEPETIGRNVSSGCIRMMNEDVIDLYERVPVGATVIVS